MKIAPNLSRLVAWHFNPFINARPAPADKDEVAMWEAAEKEARALLACARALSMVVRAVPMRMPYKVWSAAVDADARIRKVSGGKP
jgi:hypothetical protein